MLDIHAFMTPNSVKVVIAAEEMSLPYRLFPVDLRKGEQRSDGFRALHPSGKVPVLVDRSAANGDVLVLSESAAILVHLAEKSGQLLPLDAGSRAKVFEQLFFHASGLSPAFLQAFLLGIQNEPLHVAQESSRMEVERVLSLLDKTLSAATYAAGDQYTIADIGHFGWIWKHHAAKVDLRTYPAVERWYKHISARPAVIAAMAAMSTLAA